MARRPRAETPKGFRDSFGAEVVERQAMLARIAEVYRAHGFDPLETSAVETVEALGKFLPDVDRPNEGVFAWEEDPGSGDWLALRYDLTAPLARVFAQHRATLPSPYRRYAMGPVWRNEKSGPGRFRQFYQCDADTVGSASVAADAEIVGMLCEALEAVGIRDDDYVVRINSRKVLNGVLETAGLLNQSDPTLFATERGIVLRAIDKFDRLRLEGVEALLGEGRRDESGDFTLGAKLSSEQRYIVMQFIGAKDRIEAELDKNAKRLAKGSSDATTFSLAAGAGRREFEYILGRFQSDEVYDLWNSEAVSQLRDLVRDSVAGRSGVEEMETISQLLAGRGYKSDRVIIDPSTVRGLGYYTGPVFEAELTFEVLGDDGKPRQFGSVAGGGRYDDLVKRFTGEAVPATGVSIGVDRLLAALRATGRAGTEARGPVVVTVMDRERVGDALALAAELRAAGLRAEAYLGNAKGFGAQMKYADRRGAPFAVIEGEDERARGVVQVKDLAAGAAAAKGASLEEWRDRPAQAEVARTDVAAYLSARL